MSQGSSDRTQVTIAVIGAAAVIIAAVISILPQVLPEPGNNQTEQVENVLNEEPEEPVTTIDPEVEEENIPDIEAAIIATLQRAYGLKRESLREVSAEGLEEAYMGLALEKRIEPVELAEAANCFWEVILDLPEEFGFVRISDDEAQVIGTRQETRTHICNGEVQEATSIQGDRYIIIYTLANQGDRWVITDTEVSDLRD